MILNGISSATKNKQTNEPKHSYISARISQLYSRSCTTKKPVNTIRYHPQNEYSIYLPSNLLLLERLDLETTNSKNCLSEGDWKISPNKKH
jgi:hypothetical protein